mmetsp:Transcript_12235/g.29464  ORF Transcript_12235/g.29464 Transcript_12235/m.29464 type:complete len:260 (-) Transcript_12235:83-862(-)
MVMITYINIMCVVVATLTTFLSVDGYVLSPAISSVNGRRSTISGRPSTTVVFDKINSNDNFADDEAGEVISTGDILLDRRLALVRTAAMASAAAASSASVFSLPDNIEPANAIGRAEFSINQLQTDPDIVAAKNSNGDPAKHTPVVKLEKDKKGYGQILTVEIPHVMDFDKPHYIQYLWLQDVTQKTDDVRIGNIYGATAFSKPRGNASTEPQVARTVANVASGQMTTKSAFLTKNMTVKPCLYCNLHGLWEGEPISLG